MTRVTGAASATGTPGGTGATGATDLQDQVQRTIDRAVESGAEVGVQVAAYLHGEPVVDAWAGVADPASGRPVDGDTLFHSFSTGKGVTATVLHLVAERGLVDYDAPIAAYWPEFAAQGKERVTVRHALTHTAGIPQLPASTSLADIADWDRMCAVIADTAPLWEPGTATGYHGWTFGWIIGEIVRRASGRTVAEVLREEIGKPLGVEDSLFFGIPDEAAPRVATLVEGNWEALLESIPASWPFFLAVPNRDIWPTATLGNRPDYLRAHVPAGGTMSARAVARMYAALIGEVDGVRLLPPERVAQVSALATGEPDRMFVSPIAKGLGYFLALPESGTRPTAFGHNGSGGSVAFADPESGLAFACTHNLLVGGSNDTTARAVAEQIRTALGI
ncbi:serine hydrolase domain-containing protein [Kitasatospora camelliae]|uniref:Serine hydrolase domain-containing protein n=1 Tax=Kitasatospora camelliae TaxID=3156397 RepID=A0AAU8JWW4_9ACTN